MSLLSLVLKSADLPALAAALHERLGDTPDVFNHEPLLIDLTQLARVDEVAAAHGVGAEPAQMRLDEEGGAEAALDLAALLPMLRRYNMQPVAVLGANATELAQALSLGLAESPPLDQPQGSRPAMAAAVQIQEVIKEVQVEVIREVQVPTEAAKTMIIDKPLRSGQQVYAKGGDLVVLALVNHGAEVIADGSIHVYAPLRGKAMAGARGNTDARIFALALEAELLSIAGVYRTSEHPLPPGVAGRPVQVQLVPGPGGDKLVMNVMA